MNLTKEKFINLKKIAIVRTDKLGDMVLTLPMVNVLKNINPDFEISVIAKKYTEPLLVNQPKISKYYFTDDSPIQEIFKNNRFDAVFFCMPVFKECLAGLTSGIKYRIGTAYRFYSLLFNHKVYDHRKESKYHEAEYNLRMISSITDENYKVELLKPQPIIETPNRHIEQISEINKKKIIIHPGSGGSAKDLPAETFAELIRAINSNDIQIILTGIEQEKHICNFLSEIDNRIINLCGKLSLNEMMQLINQSDLLIANSTGIIHIAAALDIKTVGFYPNTPHIGPQRWRPYSEKSIVLTPRYETDNPSSIDDMSQIKLETIIEAINKQLL